MEIIARMANRIYFMANKFPRQIYHQIRTLLLGVLCKHKIITAFSLSLYHVDYRTLTVITLSFLLFKTPQTSKRTRWGKRMQSHTSAYL